MSERLVHDGARSVATVTGAGSSSPGFRIVPIEDPGDPRIAAFRDIRDRDIVGRDGVLAEGTVVLDQLLRSARFAPTALLVLRNRLQGLLPKLASLPHDVPVYVAERGVMDTIAGFPIHRGVLAHAIRRETSVADIEQLAYEGRTIVVCVGIANHDNMGAIFRNASGLGAGLVVLDETSCDPLYRKAVRVSVGTALTLPFERVADLAGYAQSLAAAGYAAVALTPRGDVSLAGWRPQAPVALFIGAEGEGLPASLIDAMTAVSIEMQPGLDSLNVATAAAIALHHVYAWRRPPA